MDIANIIVALDSPHPDQNYQLMDRLEGLVSRVKIGSIAFSSQGPKIIHYAKTKGFSVFLDLKYHDIPHTVSQAVVSICKEVDIEFVTLHALGGPRMIQEVRKELSNLGSATPKILAVTLLTSHSQEEIEQIGITSKLEERALSLGNLSIKSGADGVVCATSEVKKMRAQLGEDAIFMVPGIRLAGDDHQDQKRVATPEEAFAQGASYIVMGRSITEASDPIRVIERLQAS